MKNKTAFLLVATWLTLCCASVSHGDTVREVHAAPDGLSAVRYATSAEGWQYAAPVAFEGLTAQQQVGWTQAMQTLAALAPEGAAVEQIVLIKLPDGKVTSTEEREIQGPDGPRVETVPTAREDTYRVAVTYAREGRNLTESWEVSEPTRQFLRAMWQVFEQ